MRSHMMRITGRKVWDINAQEEKMNFKNVTRKWPLSEDICSVENTKYSINRKTFLSPYTHSVDKDNQLKCQQTSLTY